MRAYHTLRILAEKFRIHLLAGSPYFPCRASVIDQELGDLCELTTCLPLDQREHLGIRIRSLARSRFPNLYYRVFPHPFDWIPLTDNIREVLDKKKDEIFDQIHVFKHYMYPVAAYLLRYYGEVPVNLDLDDIESTTRQRISCLCRRKGLNAEANALAAEAQFFMQNEEKILPHCRKIYIASPLDRNKLLKRGIGLDVTVLPNVFLPGSKLPPMRETERFNFLFVGSLGYYPNRDAAEYMCRRVIPRLRRLTERPFALRIAGAGATKPFKRALERTAEVRVVGPLDDMTAEYAVADAVIVPLRTGGGTRIKILEAFAYRRPVVATAIGVEGIEADDGVHYLLAENADDFAKQCKRLMDSPRLSECLSDAAFELLATRYHPGVLKEVLL
jgi:glycosyltransferase involved in cell wall biosynthesis